MQPSLDNWIFVQDLLGAEAMTQNQQPGHETVAPESYFWWQDQPEMWASWHSRFPGSKGTRKIDSGNVEPVQSKCWEMSPKSNPVIYGLCCPKTPAPKTGPQSPPCIMSSAIRLRTFLWSTDRLVASSLRYWHEVFAVIWNLECFTANSQQPCCVTPCCSNLGSRPC